MERKVHGRDFVTLMDWSPGEVRSLLDLARAVKSRPGDFSSELRGKSIALLFQKTSTRTRLSFEVGIYQLGGQPVYVDWRTTNLHLGSVADEVRSMERYVDAIMARVHEHAILEEMARVASVPIINGLSDLAHPCQALADYLTMEEHSPSSRDFSVAFIGDGSNNVAFSLCVICAMLDTPVTVISPARFQPGRRLRKWLARTGKEHLVTITDDIERGIKGKDFVYTDTFVSMGQEAEQESRLATLSPFKLTMDLLDKAGAGSLAMHCLPAHRDVEISADIIDSARFIGFDQAENRLHAQKALLVKILGNR